MTFDVLSLLLNIVIACLLAATISYCFILNRRIKILQDGKSELANLLKHFDDSTTRASESIVALQSASKKIGENIQTRIDKANYLLDDLSFMVEKGNRLASQLDANFAVNRARSRAGIDKNMSDDSLHTDDIENSQERLLGKQSVVRPAEKLSTKEKTAASLEAVLDRVIGRAKPTSVSVDKESASRSKNTTNARSKAEQELLDMIRAGIKG